MTARRTTKWIFLILLPLLAAATPDLAAAGLKGKLKKGVYVPRTGNFSVEVPRGTRPRDGYWKEAGEAFVEFVDREGSFNAIWCTPFERTEQMKEVLANEERARRAFTNYFRDVIMPWIFYPISPESTVLSRAVVSFEGAPAYLFLVNVPGSSGLWDMKTNKKFDGRRATLGFNKCGYTYIVIHELVAGLGGVTKIFRGEEIPDAMIQQDMADGERALRQFLGTIRFSSCPE